MSFISASSIPFALSGLLVSMAFAQQPDSTANRGVNFPTCTPSMIVGTWQGAFDRREARLFPPRSCASSAEIAISALDPDAEPGRAMRQAIHVESRNAKELTDGRNELSSPLAIEEVLERQHGIVSVVSPDAVHSNKKTVIY